MKTYDEWLEAFTTKIKEGYETHRMDKRLAGYAYEVEKPATTLWKYDHPIKAKIMPAGQEMHLIAMPTLKLRTVEPFQVGIRVDLSKWDIEATVFWDSFMYRRGSDVAEREYWVIMKGMSDNAGTIMKAKKKGELSKLDMKDAQAWIGQNGGEYADTIVVPLEQATELLKKGELWSPHKIPTGYVPEKDRGPYFDGKMGGVNVYWTRFMKDFALIYCKRKITVSNTPLKAYYDKPKRPSCLIIEKWCSSAPILDQAVVKITL